MEYGWPHLSQGYPDFLYSNLAPVIRVLLYPWLLVSVGNMGGIVHWQAQGDHDVDDCNWVKGKVPEGHKGKEEEHYQDNTEQDE